MREINESLYKEICQVVIDNDKEDLLFIPPFKYPLDVDNFQTPTFQIATFDADSNPSFMDGSATRKTTINKLLFNDILNFGDPKPEGKQTFQERAIIFYDNIRRFMITDFGRPDFIILAARKSGNNDAINLISADKTDSSMFESRSHVLFISSNLGNCIDDITCEIIQDKPRIVFKFTYGRKAALTIHDSINFVIQNENLKELIISVLREINKSYEEAKLKKEELDREITSEMKLLIELDGEYNDIF